MSMCGICWFDGRALMDERDDLRQRVKEAEAERDKWKRLAEFEYAVRVYPENLDLGEGALDAYFKGFNYDAAKKRFEEKL